MLYTHLPLTVDGTMASNRDAPPSGFDAGEPVSGWELLARNDSVVRMIEALLSLPPAREFNQKEFSQLADVSRKSVHTHLPRLEELRIVEEVEGSAPTRYRFNPESEVSQALIKLDAAINHEGPNVNQESENIDDTV